MAGHNDYRHIGANYSLQDEDDASLDGYAADLLVDDPIDAYSSPTPLRQSNRPSSWRSPYLQPSQAHGLGHIYSGDQQHPYGSVSSAAFSQSAESLYHNEHATIESQPQQAHRLHPTWTQTGHQDQNGISRQEDPPPTAQIVNGIRLRAVSELPDFYRGIFKFGVFNAVQSSCLDILIYDDINTVVTAPTGSGKTVLFELAMIRMFNDQSNLKTKAVYMAPTKALCTERHKDWSKKFEPLGIKCCELTGDTVTYGKGSWGDAPSSRIIVTTPEKWDSLTRNWSEHENILTNMKLFLIDEVHILNESRGSTLEVCVARMKLRGSNVRFILVSATAPNISDIAHWVGKRGNSEDPAKIFTFGEQFRPCQLQRIVYGFARKQQNDFMFQKALDYKLFSIMSQHAANKPALVFCPTRKGAFQTAEQLMKDFNAAKTARAALPWHAPQHVEASFKDPQLQSLAAVGIGVHNAGLHYQDRLLVEELFVNRVLRVVCATSTLAVGVNLPAHTAIIKGTKLWQSDGWQDYSEADILQMMGRAGRPQFDKEGIAIVMCEATDQRKYENLMGGQANLESCLHLNIAEFLNAEIGLGTVTDLESAQKWLRSTFFQQRIQRNPAHYRLDKNSSQTWAERVDELVIASIGDLQKTSLVETDDKDTNKLISTQFGEIMSKYYIRLATMRLLLALSSSASLKDVLEAVCCAEELSEVRLRAGEKQIYNKLRTNEDIRFKPQKVEKTSDKVFVLLQAILGGISLSDKEHDLGGQAHLDGIPLLRHAPRFARALTDIGIEKRSGALIKSGLELLRSLNARAWDGRPVVLRQIENLGEKSIKVLLSHGITSLQKLRVQDPIRLEALLNRRPPFGLEVLQAVKEIPEYELRIIDESVKSFNGTRDLECTLTLECSAIVEIPRLKRKKQRMALGSTNVLTIMSDETFIDFRRISTKALTQASRTFTIQATIARPSQYIEISISAENFAGTQRVITWRPSVSATDYPVRNTRPKTEQERDVEQLMADPEFWAEFDEPMDDDTSRKFKAAETEAPKSVIVAELDQSDQNLVSPLKRLDGKYDCNHSCKDKTACRHMCCRDGLDKPPKTNKSAPQTRVKDPATARRHASTMGSLTAPSAHTERGNAGSSSVAQQSTAIKTQRLMHNTEFFEPDDGSTSLEPPTKKRKVHHLPVEVKNQHGTATTQRTSRPLFNASSRPRFVSDNGSTSLTDEHASHKLTTDISTSLLRLSPKSELTSSPTTTRSTFTIVDSNPTMPLFLSSQSADDFQTAQMIDANVTADSDQHMPFITASLGDISHDDWFIDFDAGLSVDAGADSQMAHEADMILSSREPQLHIDNDDSPCPVLLNGASVPHACIGRHNHRFHP
ncbi:Sec63 Brl domain-containing protein [Auriculariales sp. MPI-PUGE-AT-0066]|nr:Sec63 Brl domain-containing protein [Auriculariales sp. MPI-PUGE-AT-0066]